MEAQEAWDKVAHLRLDTARAMHVAACALELTEEEALEWRDVKLEERQKEIDHYLRVAEERDAEERARPTTGRRRRIRRVGWREMLGLKDD